MTSKWLRTISMMVIITVVLLSGCDSTDEPASDRASLSGVVLHAETEVPVEGAVVSIEGRPAITTAADGRFSFDDLPVGTVTLGVSAEGFEEHVASVSLARGANTREIRLPPQTLFAHDTGLVRFELRVPSQLERIRGVVFMLAGAGGNSLIFPRDVDLQNAPEELVRATREQRARYFEMARTHDLVIMGADTRDNTNTKSMTDVFDALDVFADMSGHQELRYAPIMLWGYSLGGCFAYRLMDLRMDRILGFISQKGGCHESNEKGASKSIPGYLVIGENDTVDRASAITSAFETNRSGGALWALLIDPDAQHEPVEVNGGIELIAGWIETVIDLRLPAAPAVNEPVVLRALDESAGWLGNRTTFEIGAHGCYNSDPKAAAWFPSFETARAWQQFASEGTVDAVVECT